MSQPIAVAATSPFGADVLERLAARHEIRAVLTRPDAPAGRGRKLAAPPAKGVGSVSAFPFYSRMARPGLELGAPTVVVVAYGKLIRKRSSGTTRLNVHPSLLPRGARAPWSGR
jgi:methionyl-tRNA formyltransferase